MLYLYTVQILKQTFRKVINITEDEEIFLTCPPASEV